MTRVPAPKLMTLEEGSESGRHPVRTLRMWIADGRLRATRPGRRVLIRRADLAACLGVPESDLEIEAAE